MRKSGGIPWVSTRYSLLSMDNEQADTGRDGRTRLARPNSQAGVNGDRKMFIFPVQLTDREQNFQPYPVEPYSAIIM